MVASTVAEFASRLKGAPRPASWDAPCARIRGGADVFKALALGATAVLIGRPYVYGLAIAGAAGVREVLENFRADFELTMALAGCPSLAQIDADTLAPGEPLPVSANVSASSS